MLDLVKILKDCPKGTKLYSTVQDEVVFDCVKEADIDYPIYVSCYNGIERYTRDGRFDQRYNGECVLFPSKDQRDWSKFKAPVKKFDYSKLQPYDRVLVRSSDEFLWRCNFFSNFSQNVAYCVSNAWNQMIPYNDQTKHLVGTANIPDEKYIWWE